MGLVVGVVGMGLAANQLLSFQIDEAGMKGLARAILSDVGTEMKVAPALQSKVTAVVERAIDQAGPAVREAQAAAAALADAPESARKPASERLQKALIALVDVKDRVVTDAGRTLAPRERAGLIVRVADRMARGGTLDDATLEKLGDHFRHHRQANITEALQLSADRATAIFSKMDGFAARRKALFLARRPVLAKLRAAVTGTASDSAIVAHLTEWDKLTAQASDVGREQITQAAQVMTLDEQARLADHARTKVGRILKIAGLIAKFAPVK